jgi:hypothetical protein
MSHASLNSMPSSGLLAFLLERFGLSFSSRWEDRQGEHSHQEGVPYLVRSRQPVSVHRRPSFSAANWSGTPSQTETLYRPTSNVKISSSPGVTAKSRCPLRQLDRSGTDSTKVTGHIAPKVPTHEYDGRAGGARPQGSKRTGFPPSTTWRTGSSRRGRVRARAAASADTNRGSDQNPPATRGPTTGPSTTPSPSRRPEVQRGATPRRHWPAGLVGRRRTA